MHVGAIDILKKKKITITMIVIKCIIGDVELPDIPIRSPEEQASGAGVGKYIIWKCFCGIISRSARTPFQRISVNFKFRFGKFIM